LYSANLGSRRRPALRPKESPTLSGNTNKFVTLAETRSELARLKIAQLKEIHAMNLKIKEKELEYHDILVEQEKIKLQALKDQTIYL
jgi:hypothetical protein